MHSAIYKSLFHWLAAGKSVMSISNWSLSPKKIQISHVHSLHLWQSSRLGWTWLGAT